jgi:HSP20 family protein
MFTLDRLLRDMDITYRTDYNSYNASMVIEDDNLIMEFEVPGFSKKDLNVKVENNVLSVSACTEDRSFDKSYKLNNMWDGTSVSAEAKNGILTITIPKKEEMKSKVIEVKVK